MTLTEVTEELETTRDVPTSLNYRLLRLEGKAALELTPLKHPKQEAQEGIRAHTHPSRSTMSYLALSSRLQASKLLSLP